MLFRPFPRIIPTPTLGQYGIITTFSPHSARLYDIDGKTTKDKLAAVRIERFTLCSIHHRIRIDQFCGGLDT